MEEHQVTIEGETRPLPEPFFVIATQNPIAPDRHLPAAGIAARPLPDAHRTGLPRRAAERALLEGRDRRSLLAETQPILTPEILLAEQARAATLHVAAPLFDYVQALVAHTRNAPEWKAGLSPRAGLGLIAAARAWALLDGRDHVLPEDVQAVLPAVAVHRLPTAGDQRNADEIAKALIEAVPLP